MTERNYTLITSNGVLVGSLTKAQALTFAELDEPGARVFYRDGTELAIPCCKTNQ